MRDRDRLFDPDKHQILGAIMMAGAIASLTIGFFTWGRIVDSYWFINLMLLHILVELWGAYLFVGEKRF